MRSYSFSRQAPEKLFNDAEFLRLRLSAFFRLTVETVQTREEKSFVSVFARTTTMDAVIGVAEYARIQVSQRANRTMMIEEMKILCGDP